MVRPGFVTFTGVDDKTDIAAMRQLGERYPIEWGVLVGGRLGKNRYPGSDTIDRLVEANRRHGLRLAKHLCGSLAYAAASGTGDPPSTLGFQRVQVNAREYDLAAVATLHCRTALEIIIQHRVGPFPELPPGVLALHDPSGGKGKRPAERPAQTDFSRPVGYAGGIKAENVLDVLARIDAHNFWIDMESGVRTDDWFDLAKCEAVCRAIWG